MKIGAVNNLKTDLIDEIHLISKDGFDFIDMALEPGFSHQYDPREVKSALKAAGLGIVGHTSAFLPSVFPLKDVGEACMKELEHCVEFFSKAGAGFITLHPFSASPHIIDVDEQFKENRRIISGLSIVCAYYGVTLMVENTRSPFNSPTAFDRLLDNIDDVKMHLDIGHCNLDSCDGFAEEFFNRFGDRIVHIHFSDNFGHEDNHLPPGCGNVDWHRMIGIIKRFGYDSTITLEVFTADRSYLLAAREYIKRLWSM